MNPMFADIIQKLISEQGESILSNPKRVSAFFADLAQDIPKPQKTAFIKCLEHGFLQIFKNANEVEHSKCKEQLAQKLHNEEGFDIGLCRKSIDLLERVLFGEQKRRKKCCEKCSKELLEEWKVCPYCGVQIFTQGSSLISSDSGIGAYGIGVIKPSLIIPIALTQSSMILINGGTFIMGSSSDEQGWKNELQHQVAISPFYMGIYPVTQKEYRKVMGIEPSHFKGDNLPVEMVNWFDAIKYCNRLSQSEGLTSVYTGNEDNVKWNHNANGFRLPTEAEWEYACRAGTTTTFSTGNNITTGQANYDGNYPYNRNAIGEFRERTTAVGSFAANPWGLYDMHGNVCEWCWDWYGDYKSNAYRDSTGAVYGYSRVIRGGSWFSNGHGLRSARREAYSPSRQAKYLGFRLARNAE